MGITIMSGSVTGMSEFLLSDRSIVVASFLAMIVAMVSGAAIWIWFLGGDDYLIWARMFDGSPKKLKIQIALALFAIIFIIVSGCYLFRPSGIGCHSIGLQNCPELGE